MRRHVRQQFALLCHAALLCLPTAFAAATRTSAQADESAPLAITRVRVIAIVPGPSQLDAFRRPTSLGVDPARAVLVVADTGHQRLAVFDVSGRARGTIPYAEGRPLDVPATQRAPRPAEPSAVAIDARSRLYVVDSLNHTIEVLTARGSHLGWLQPPIEAVQSGAALAEYVTVGPSGRLYVLYAGEQPGVAVLDAAGGLLSAIGFEAQPPRLLQAPLCVTVDPQESLLAIADPRADEVVLLLAPDGSVVRRFGRHGEGEGTFSMAVHVAFGPRGTLWVTDAVRHSISVFDALGTPVGRIGGRGAGPGQFEYPAGCAFVADNRLVVLERSSARFQLLEVEMAANRHLPVGPSRQASGPLPSPFPAEQGG